MNAINIAITKCFTTAEDRKNEPGEKGIKKIGLLISPVNWWKLLCGAHHFSTPDNSRFHTHIN